MKVLGRTKFCRALWVQSITFTSGEILVNQDCLMCKLKFLGAFSVTSRGWISTSRRSNVATFKRRDANLTLL